MRQLSGFALKKKKEIFKNPQQQEEPLFWDLTSLHPPPVSALGLSRIPENWSSFLGKQF